MLDGLAVGYVVDTGRAPPRPAAAAPTRSAGPGRRGLLHAEHFFHMRCEVSTEQVRRRLRPVRGGSLISLVSLMDHTPGQRQYVSVEKYRAYNQGKYGLSDAELDDAHRLGDSPDQAALRRGPSCRHRPAVSASTVCPWRATTTPPRRMSRKRCKAGRGHRGVSDNHRGGGGRPRVRPRHRCGRPESRAAGARTRAMSRPPTSRASGLLDILSSDYVPASLLHAAFLLHISSAAGAPRGGERHDDGDAGGACGAAPIAARSPRGGAPISCASGWSRDCRSCAGVWRGGRRIA